MLRVVGLALLVLVGATPAAANDGRPGETSAAGARYGTTAPAGAGSFAQAVRPPVQPQGVWTTAPSLLPGTGSASARGLPGSPMAAPATLAPERRDGGSWLVPDNSGLKLPMTERLSVGVGYRHLEGEDLWHRHAEAGSVDYDSHDFILRAHWRF